MSKTEWMRYFSQKKTKNGTEPNTDFSIFARKTKLEDYLEAVKGEKPEIGPEGPVLSHLEEFNSIKAIRSDKKTQLIALDDEWKTDTERHMLSYQMATIKDGILYEVLILSETKNRLAVKRALGIMLDILGYEPQNRDTEKNYIDITLACHAGLGDITGLYDKDHNLLKQCTEIQGGLLTLRPVFRTVPSYRDGHIDEVYNVKLNVADSMAHAVGDHKGLDSLGQIIGIPKIELSDEIKGNMDLYLKDNPEGFAEYAMRDAVITLVYLSAMYGINHQIPVTLSSAAAKYAKESIMKTLGCTNEKDFARKYKGTKRIRNGMGYKDNKHYIKEYEDFLNDAARQVDGIAALAYLGGYNTSTDIGHYSYMTYDYDLRNAYPTVMYFLMAIDWEKPIREKILDRFITLEDFTDGPTTMMYAYVKFEFPKGVKYPTIPVKLDAVPVFLRTSNTLDGVYACGPEIYLALKLGAKVYCERGYTINTLKERVLANAIKMLIVNRAEAEDKGLIFEAEIIKTITNIIYGKIAQDVDPKNTWSAQEDGTVNIGPSAITNPIYAAMITSIVRAVLLAAQNEMKEMGYHSYSVTTDGLISNLPPEKIENLELYGFAECLREAREYLTGESTIWKKKHWQDDLLNISTRGNVSMVDHGVCAHNGYKTGKESDSYEDRYEFIKAVLERTGKMSYEYNKWPSLKDIIQKGIDFILEKSRKSVNMEYDMKRKPVRDSIETIPMEFDGKTYEVTNFTTEPFEDAEEFLRYRDVKKKTKCLKTKDQLERFLVRAENEGYNGRIQDMEFSRLMSAVMAHRSREYIIPMLDEKIPLKDKIVFINSFNNSDRIFTEDHWKECRKPERIAHKLPVEEVKDILDRMAGA